MLYLSLYPWERLYASFTIVRSSSQIRRGSLARQTRRTNKTVLCWSGVAFTKHTSSSNEEEQTISLKFTDAKIWNFIPDKNKKHSYR